MMPTNAKLRLLCANDVYKPEKFSVMKTLKDRYQGEGTTKCILAGDFLGGSLFSTLSKGESMIQVCNSVGFDYVVIGNHEFDYGEDRLKELMDMSSYPWLGSNIRMRASTETMFHKTVLDIDIFECGSYRVGVFGVCTASTPNLSSPSSAVIFEDEVEHAQRATSLLRAQGCEVILALTHVSLAVDRAISAIAGVNLIIGGHDHDPSLLLENETLIIKCGQNIEHLGVIDLDIFTDPVTGHVEVRHSFQLLCTFGMPSHPAVDAVIEHYTVDHSTAGEPVQLSRVDASAAASSENNTTTTTTTAANNNIMYSSLSTRSCDVRIRESASVCMVADAMLYSYTQLGYACDFAFLNGGFVRGDRLYPPGCPLLKSDVLNELPFEREPVLLCLLGKDVWAGLEQMLAGAPRPVGSFPHMSEHFQGSYNLKQDPLSRIQDISIRGQPIDLEKEYRVVLSDFYASKEGDGVEAFLGKPLIHNHGRIISSVVCEYLATRDSVSGAAPGRFCDILASS
jgi:2',3'-cyclic-nucleotide 2'-phosphodiesterase (5'-nucleotidase family)